MQKVIIFLMPAVVFSIALIYVPCADAQKIEYVDGVRIVHNEKPKWGDNPKVKLEFVKQIGVFEGPDENYMFYKPSHINKDSDGNIYILDSGNYRIQKFDPDGKYLATFGRKGQGPSEFERPISLEIDSEGNLYVGNDFNSLVIILNPQGKEIRRFRIIGERCPNFRMNKNNNFVVPNIAGRLGEGVKGYSPYKLTDGLLRIYDEQGNFIKEFVQRRKYDSPVMILEGNKINFTIDSNKDIFVAFIHQNRIEKYSNDGVLIQKIDRKKNYSETTKIRLIPNAPIPHINIFSMSIDVDSKGRIWVMSLKRQPTDEEKKSDIVQFEIFDNNGILLGILPWDYDVKYIHEGLPQQSLTMRIFDNLLYVIDQDNEMVVYEYKIIDL